MNERTFIIEGKKEVITIYETEEKIYDLVLTAEMFIQFAIELKQKYMYAEKYVKDCKPIDSHNVFSNKGFVLNNNSMIMVKLLHMVFFNESLSSLGSLLSKDDIDRNIKTNIDLKKNMFELSLGTWYNLFVEDEGSNQTINAELLKIIEEYSTNSQLMLFRNKHTGHKDLFYSPSMLYFYANIIETSFLTKIQSIINEIKAFCKEYFIDKAWNNTYIVHYGKSKDELLQFFIDKFLSDFKQKEELK